MLKQFFGSARTLMPSQRLPAEAWCEAAGLGRMSIVWPWYQIAEPQPLVDEHGRELAVRPALELRAPRSGEDLVLVIWSGTGEGIVVGPDWGRSVVRMYQGARIEVNAPFQIDGVVGRVARFGDSTSTTWRILVPRESAAFHLEITAPVEHAEAYWAQIESMLATWGWND